MAGESGAMIALTMFFLALPLALFTLPFWMETHRKKFNDNEVVHLIIKRCCWILATWLMTLTSAVMLTISNAAGLNLNAEITRYLWIFGWGGYLLMFYTTWRTLIDAITLRTLQKKQERYGDDV